jgi:hypothetical protein
MTTSSDDAAVVAPPSSPSHRSAVIAADSDPDADLYKAVPTRTSTSNSSSSDENDDIDEEEEKLFHDLEDHKNDDEDPNAVKQAPNLLKAALAKGEIKEETPEVNEPEKAASAAPPEPETGSKHRVSALLQGQHMPLAPLSLSPMTAFSITDESIGLFARQGVGI